MYSRQAYEREAVASIARAFTSAPAISDDTRDDEHRAAAMVVAAWAQFRSIIQDAAALTDLRKDALNDLLAVMDDAMPDALAWDEAISNAKRGY